MAMRASDLHKENPHLKMLIFGDSGSGKTMQAARSPKPFVILTEQKSIASVAVANPNAMIQTVSSWRGFETIWEAIKRGVPNTLENGQPCFRFSGAEEQYTSQTIVFDSLTRLHAMLVEQETNGDNVNWMRIQATFHAFLLDMGTLPVSVVAVALASTEYNDLQEQRIVPDLFGKMSQKVSSYFEAVAYMAKRRAKDGEKGTKAEHVMCFDLPSRYITKMPPTLQAFPRTLATDIREPGHSTLGSILMFCHPDLDVAHGVDDAPGLIKEASK